MGKLSIWYITYISLSWLKSISIGACTNNDLRFTIPIIIINSQKIQENIAMGVKALGLSNFNTAR